MIKVLDHGSVELVQHWGSDEDIIRAARQSTDGAFRGWGSGQTAGDEKLLSYLYRNRHMSPFEMAGATFEVKAPIFVFREWHRHRTQSYNEMSARYIPIPNEHYLPDRDRILVLRPVGNKQAAGIVDPNPQLVDNWLARLADFYALSEELYQQGLEVGVQKEIARLPMAVARYSKMWAQANLRNWLQFLELREHESAQWEIQEYASAVHAILRQHFPRTLALYEEVF